MNEWNAPGIRNAYDLDKKVASNASDEVNDRQSSSQSSGEMNTFSKDEIPHDVQGTNLGPQKPIMPTVTPSSIIFRSPYYTFPPFPDAGLSLSQAQAVNEKWYMKTLDNQFLYQEKNIELDKRYREKLINQAFSNKVEGFHSTKDVHNNIVPIPSKFDLNEFGNSFIQEHAIVKIRDRRQKDGILYMIRSEEYNRHVPMEPSELQKEYGFLLFDYELSDTQRKYAFHILSRKIPFLTQSPLKKLEDYQVMFKNGYYDLHNQTFFKIPSEERIKFYNEFSLEFDYIEEDTNPIVFEKMLSDMFDGDNIKIHLAYQYIGAFLTPVSTLKKIFVFQGKSNGGKTRLSNVIIKLMPENDTEVLGTTAEISAENAKNPLLPRRLIYIREHGDKSIPKQQKTSLKSASDGLTSLGRKFKILMNTNYPITTGGSYAIDPSVYNRLTVLPFPKVMDNKDEVSAFEDVYFEQEKSAIARKALAAFSDVLKNDNKFNCPFEINECIEAEDVQLDSVPDQESQKMDPRIIEVLDKYFVLTEEVNLNMTAEMIMIHINKILPDAIPTTARMGRILSDHYKERLTPKQVDLPGNNEEQSESRKRNQKTCYNLKFAVLTETYNG